MNAITQQKDSIILENDRARISLGTKDACVASVTDKKTGREICKEKTAFFGLATREEALSARISLEDGVITVSTSLGDFRVRAEAFDDYFTFEILDELPKGAHLPLPSVLCWPWQRTPPASGIPLSPWQISTTTS